MAFTKLSRLALPLLGSPRTVANVFPHLFQQCGSHDWSIEWNEACDWAVEQFGDPAGRIEDDRRWFLPEGQMFLGIRSDVDATAFKIRWC